MKKNLLHFSAVLPVLLCAGCSLFSPHHTESSDYDLRVPETRRITPVIPVSFGVFSNFSGAGTRMIDRDDKGMIRIDEYNRWLLPPEQLFYRGMMELFNPVPGQGKKVRIHCRILRFETDCGKAVLETAYQLRLDDREKECTHRFETQLKGSDGSAVAAAMSANLLKAAEGLNREISVLAVPAGKKGK